MGWTDIGVKVLEITSRRAVATARQKSFERSVHEALRCAKLQSPERLRMREVMVEKTRRTQSERCLKDGNQETLVRCLDRSHGYSRQHHSSIYIPASYFRTNLSGCMEADLLPGVRKDMESTSSTDSRNIRQRKRRRHIGPIRTNLKIQKCSQDTSPAQFCSPHLNK
ncbi:hypothetical protein BS47DRAFT_1158425 [Hydnum rufescens UP504]|uniref:Uncharacterized protein n=1 Tax=Hydnum rufescens UP504 TaxID=1448309 RepID=A0A9P6DUF4_9AGAM|nr:hypothetical protein BS47DRAFT_1158425 [Hydnum rufescens UP504]